MVVTLAPHSSSCLHISNESKMSIFKDKCNTLMYEAIQMYVHIHSDHHHHIHIIGCTLESTGMSICVLWAYKTRYSQLNAQVYIKLTSPYCP